MPPVCSDTLEGWDGRDRAMGERMAVGESAVLVIRVWREDETANSFRARILYEGAGEQAAVSSPTTDPEDVVVAVRRWLADHS